jgi:hypothetical protein
MKMSNNMKNIKQDNIETSRSIFIVTISLVHSLLLVTIELLLLNPIILSISAQ